jgi:phage FluMu protein Com
MALVFKKCPHCRALLPDTNAGIYIESPFRNCDKCGKLFIDSERNEWACASLFLKIGFVFRYSISSFAYALIPTGLGFVDKG